MVIEVDLYKEIRKMTQDGMSQREIAKKLGISRQSVKKYGSGETIPGNRKEYFRSSSMVTPEVITFINSCFEEDERENITKQKHTAKRIYDRLTTEMNFTGGESTIRRTVRSLKADRLVPARAVMPLSYEPGEAMQVDWGIGTVYLSGIKTKLNLFCARLCYSCDIFVVAFKAANEESFLEAHQLAIEHFGGVPRRVIFDNARVAVKEGFGQFAKPQNRYLSFSAHYAFDLDFCNPAKGNEKGLVENLVGYSRRNFLVPVIRTSSINAVNADLKAKCLKYRDIHKIQGRNQPVAEMYNHERLHLAVNPRFRYDTSKTVIAKANDFSTVRFEKNNYSVPTRFLMQEITVKGYGNEVKLMHRNSEVASYERCYGSGKTMYCLEHYIDLLERKPRSVRNARPVKDTVAHELLEWAKLLPGGNKEMVKLLRLCVDYGQDRILDIKHSIPSGIIPTVDLIRSYLVPSVSHGVLHLKQELDVETVDLSVYDRKFGMVVEQ